MSKKRLDHDDRINLQAGMAKGLSLRDVALVLKKSRSTIYGGIISYSRYLD
ncbi:MAG: helix-turn-helix domain-containing protein [Bacillales bacterium]|nr:helix-turn-helix domain-containing protein [Bacillales bacterium]MDY4935233.1 helix-turn-helix domain-containing protein [Candidatus Enteromonas sp.]